MAEGTGLTSIPSTACPTAVSSDPRPVPSLAAWQAAVLRGLVLAGGTLALGGAFTLFAIGLLANGRGIGVLGFSWTLFAFSGAAGLAQGWLSLLGCRAALRAIAERTP